jgi:hypothetical protein
MRYCVALALLYWTLGEIRKLMAVNENGMKSNESIGGMESNESKK